MATIILTAVGTALGGPIGAAIGFLAGEKIGDGPLFGGKGAEGPRVPDLGVTTSTYGRPIPRHFGSMRVAGSVIWSTDLVEHRETSGGGKGKPKTTAYSYSVSFAVALGSQPIESIGRIWADGKLLRGRAGDLKVDGSLRIYRGHGDQMPDPIIAASETNCPAFRNCAYVVFEDLEVGDFGNRIPSLSFEVFGTEASELTLRSLLAPSGVAATTLPVPNILGFSDEGGQIRLSLDALSRLYPLSCVDTGGSISVDIANNISIRDGSDLSTLMELNQSESSGHAALSVEMIEKHNSVARSIRYYDLDRDYQPGVQRAAGPSGDGDNRTLDLGASMDASGARTCVNEHAQRSRWITERMQWRVAELDPGIVAGAHVKVPDHPGVWKVLEWEWSDEGVQLTLERVPPDISNTVEGSPGLLKPPVDGSASPTILEFFELPQDGTTDPTTKSLYAAATAEGEIWKGAALYAENGSTLEPLGQSIDSRACVGTLNQPLPASVGLAFETGASLIVELAGGGPGFYSTDISGISRGENRILVGDEILQFHTAEQLTPHQWRLTGLLRGRGGTEHAALGGHASGTRIVALDDRIVALDPARLSLEASTRLAAIGFGDEQPAYAELRGAGASRRPLSPVHPKSDIDTSGNWTIQWTRRARGQWHWSDLVEVPLIEEAERYLVGVGDLLLPAASWQVNEPLLRIDATTIADLAASIPGAPIWVAQIGTFNRSPATLVAKLPL